MHNQIDLLDGQINERPDGSIEIHGQRGYAVFKGEYATKTKMAYRQLLEQYPTDDSLKIAINVEVPQPVGQFVNEASPRTTQPTDTSIFQYAIRVVTEKLHTKAIQRKAWDYEQAVKARMAIENSVNAGVHTLKPLLVNALTHENVTRDAFMRLL